MIDLSHKRALVTGSGRRVGKQIALALGAKGMDVAVHYNRSREDAEQTCRQIQAFGSRAVLVQADLAKREDSRATVQRAADQLGGLDLLVLSASAFETIPIGNVTDDAWDRTLELNLSSPFAAAQKAYPLLEAVEGSIVFITCSSATTPFKNHLPYVVSKGALRHLMQTLALEFAPAVRVNAVAPGTVLPPVEMSEKSRQDLAAVTPLKRLGSAQDVAQAVVFLAESSFVTGLEVIVDGGRHVAKVERFG